MADKLQWFKFYATDWLSDAAVRVMTARQRGWYIDLLCWAWQETGFLPNAAEVICQVVRDRSELDYMDDDYNLQCRSLSDELDEVVSHFTVNLGNGKVSHCRLEEQRSAALSASLAKSEAARSTNAKRGGKRIAKRALRASDSLSSSGSSEELQEKEKTSTRARKLPAGYEFDEQYGNFRAALKSWGAPVIDPEDFIDWAWTEWKLLDPEQRQAAVDGVKQRELDGADPAFCKSPEKFLKGREWKRPIVAPRAPKSRLDRLMDSI